MKKFAILNPYYCFLITAAFTLALLGCQKNYYAIIMQDGTCLKEQYELTKECHDSIVNHAPINLASFDGHQDVLDSVVVGIHTLLTAPMKFPRDKKMFGLATLQEAGMNDFLETFLSDPDANLNEKFTNFVLNAAPIQYGCSLIESSYYLIDGIRICKPDTATPGVLLHEARHKTAGWHDTHCPPELKREGTQGAAISNFIYECDKGMDLIYGWEIVLQWGLLQGAPQAQVLSPLIGLSANAWAGGIVDRLSNIRLVPEALVSLTDEKARIEYARNFVEIENLAFPNQVTPVHFEKQSETVLSKPLVGAQAGDFNRDGRQDLIFIFTDQVQAFLNQGSGSFVPAEGFRLLTECVDFKLAVITGDFNHDGNLDVVFSCAALNSGGSGSTIVSGKGDGTFSAASIQEQSKENESIVDFTDLNGDGKRELVRGFRRKREPFIDLYQGEPIQFIAELPFGEIVRFFKIKDVNHDNIPDVVLIGDSVIEVFLGQGGNLFHLVPTVIETRTPGSNWRLGDFDGDGNDDLLGNYSGAFCVTPFLGSGTGNFIRTADYLCGHSLEELIHPFDTYGFFRDYIIVDFNGDLRMDLVALDAQGNAEVAFSRGSLSYRSVGFPEVFAHHTEGSRNFIVVADFTGDGGPDLVFVTAETDPDLIRSNRFSLFTNQGLP